MPFRDALYPERRGYTGGIDVGDKVKQGGTETLRDTFAAAALTGLLSRTHGKAGEMAEAAYRIADAMLAERAIAKCDTTQSYAKHDENRGDSDTIGAQNMAESASSCCKTSAQNETCSGSVTPEPVSKSESIRRRREVMAGAYADITARLRRWAHAVDAISASDLMDKAADEIERLRTAIRRLADQDATLSVQGGNVIVEMDATLTDAEREAVGNVLHHIATRADHLQREAHDLRGLLKRLG